MTTEKANTAKMEDASDHREGNDHPPIHQYPITDEAAQPNKSDMMQGQLMSSVTKPTLNLEMKNDNTHAHWRHITQSSKTRKEFGAASPF